MTGTKAAHGTRSRYCYGCHCECCMLANAEYMREWRARRLRARTHRLVHGYFIRLDAKGADR